MGRQRVAAVDCGTNSIRLLVAEVAAGSRRVTDVVREMDIVRLGEGVDRTGRLAPAAIERTLAACQRYRKRIDAAGVTRIRFAATSAMRDAGNRAEFIAGVRERLGVEPEIISGAQEAALSFAGATGSLAQALEPGPTLVVDIGGGSTEFVLGDAVSGRITGCFSIDIGCVRITERWLRTDPPTDAEVMAAVADIDAGIKAAAQVIDFAAAVNVVGVAGTVTTIAAIALGLRQYESDSIHGCVLTQARVNQVVDQLVGMSRRQRTQIPVMHPGRADVIGGGALVLARVLESAGARQIVASEHDILDGIALSLAKPN